MFWTVLKRSQVRNPILRISTVLTSWIWTVLCGLPHAAGQERAVGRDLSKDGRRRVGFLRHFLLLSNRSMNYRLVLYHKFLPECNRENEKIEAGSLRPTSHYLSTPFRNPCGRAFGLPSATASGAAERGADATSLATPHTSLPKPRPAADSAQRKVWRRLACTCRQTAAASPWPPTPPAHAWRRPSATTTSPRRQTGSSRRGRPCIFMPAGIRRDSFCSPGRAGRSARFLPGR